MKELRMQGQLKGGSGLSHPTGALPRLGLLGAALLIEEAVHPLNVGHVAYCGHSSSIRRCL